MKSAWYDLGGRLAKVDADLEMPGCYVVNEFTGRLSSDPRVEVAEARTSGCQMRELGEHEKQAMLRRIRQTAVRRWRKALATATTIDALDALAERLPYESGEWWSAEIPELREQLVARFNALRASHGDGRPISCPNCGSRRVIPIRYGYPTDETQAAALRGEVQLGGCCIFDDMPMWSCRTCEHAW